MTNCQLNNSYFVIYYKNAELISGYLKKRKEKLTYDICDGKRIIRLLAFFNSKKQFVNFVWLKPLIFKKKVKGKIQITKKYKRFFVKHFYSEYYSKKRKAKLSKEKKRKKLFESETEVIQQGIYHDNKISVIRKDGQIFEVDFYNGFFLSKEYKIKIDGKEYRGDFFNIEPKSLLKRFNDKEFRNMVKKIVKEFEGGLINLQKTRFYKSLEKLLKRTEKK